MYLRDLQITLAIHDFKIYPLLRDSVWESIELSLSNKIPKKFLFGNIKKVVIEVGSEESKREFYEVLGIGIYHYPNFIVSEFMALEKRLQMQQTIDMVRFSFERLEILFNTKAPWVFEELARLEAANA